jgi:pyrimidine deaminase RibD-like protein
LYGSPSERVTMLSLNSCALVEYTPSCLDMCCALRIEEVWFKTQDMQQFIQIDVFAGQTSLRTLSEFAMISTPAPLR